MRLAIIDQATNEVINCVIPPANVGDVFFLPAGTYGILTAVGCIGDTYDKETEQFIPPAEEPVEDQPQE